MKKTNSSKSPATSTRLGRVRFAWNGPVLASATVAGAFNEWNPTATPLDREADGTWAVDLDLPIGRHEYRFIIDGQWVFDPSNPNLVPNPFGSMNSVVEVTGDIPKRPVR